MSYEFTKHAKKRMQQRGITKKMVELAMEHGILVMHGRKLLNAKKLNVMTRGAAYADKTIRKAKDKGGIAVGFTGNRIDTVFIAYKKVRW
ncbi:MAG: DUF4258 domain-containing protein [Planctomycetota bacterium]|nr:DUF4258 domain-containing protein [Planctomycetota bacterium]